MKGIVSWVSPVLLSSALLMSAGIASAATAVARDVAQEESNRQLVLEFYDRFFNKHEVQQAAQVVAEDYIQHNPQVPDGKAPFVGYFGTYFKDNPQSRAKIVRSASDGDLVYLHVHSTNGKADRGQAVIDIFRVQGGKIVEHWDVIQAVPEQAANSNTMF